MKIKVIELLLADGTTGYLKDTHCLSSNAVVKHPLEAKNYLVPEYERFRRNDEPYDPESEIMKDLHDLRMQGDEWYARSGVACVACYTVEFEIAVTETDRNIGRHPHRKP